MHAVAGVEDVWETGGRQKEVVSACAADLSVWQETGGHVNRGPWVIGEVSVVKITMYNR